MGGRTKVSHMTRTHDEDTAPAAAEPRIPRLFCPRCQDLIIAASGSEHVSANEVRHSWACEACGHAFRTTVRWVADGNPGDGDQQQPGVGIAPETIEPEQV